MSTAVKIASLTTDVYSDKNAVVAALLPADLHQCKVASEDTIKALPDHCFGLIVQTGEDTRRLFPCHDEEALKLSQAYLAITGPKLPPEVRDMADAKLAAVAACFAAGGADAVETDSDEYRGFKKVAFLDALSIRPRVKISHAETCFGLVIDGQNRFPLHTPALTKTAVARFPFTAEGLDPGQRFSYAQTLTKRAAALDVEIPFESPINHYNNPEINLGALETAIDARVKHAAAVGLESTVLDQLRTEAGILAPRGSIETENSWLYRQAKHAAAKKLGPAETVAVLASFDKFAGIDETQYRTGLPDPFASCFKRASMGRGMLVDGVNLSSLTLGDLTNTFDTDFVRNFLANPVGVYQSLPEPTRAVIRNLAQKAGGGEAKRPITQFPSNTSSMGDPMSQLNPIYGNGIPLSGD